MEDWDELIPSNIDTSAGFKWRGNVKLCHKQGTEFSILIKYKEKKRVFKKTNYQNIIL